MSSLEQELANTIAAIATPPGIGSIAVVRVSGNGAVSACDTCFRGKVTLEQSPTHTLHYGRWVSDAETIDTVVVSVFRGPQSYTGEDVVEVSCHGGRYMADMVLQSVLDKGVRLADPGEFTRRAFLNRRLDLTQVEAVADIIHAETRIGAQTAARQLEGGFTRRIAVFRERLLDVIGLLELELDFSEEDVEFANRDSLRTLLTDALASVEDLAGAARGAEILRSGFYVAVVGYPNAGKSSLFNAILGVDRAIVSNMPGTTRDYVSEVVLVDGYSLHLLDTAGLRDTDDAVEVQGISLTKSVINRADCIVVVNDASAGTDNSDVLIADLLQTAGSRPVLVVQNKSDLVDGMSVGPMQGVTAVLSCSAITNSGVQDLLKQIVALAASSHDSHMDVLVNARQATLLTQIAASLRSATSALNHNVSPDLIALDIRAAIRLLGDITGEAWNPDVLSSIFSRFCIGK